MAEPRVPREHGEDDHVPSGAYVLDALEPTELAEFDAHLADCALCQVDVREFRETLSGMKQLLGQPPPPSLGDTVLSRIRGVEQLPPETEESSSSRTRGGA